MAAINWKPFEKLSKNIGNYLKLDTKYSSIRLMTLMTVFTGDITILAIASAAVGSVMKEKPFDWLGAAAFVGAVGTIIGMALWGKNAGKSIETKTDDGLQKPADQTPTV